MTAVSTTAPGGLRRGLGFAGDFAGLMGLALLVPFAILAFGLPFVLLIKAVLWLLGAD